MDSPRKSDKNQDSDKTWESLLRISEEAHTTKNIEEFVAAIHSILSDLVKARNFFIALYDESADKYFFPYFVDEYDTIETTGINSAYDESLEVTLYEASGTLTDYVRRTGKPIRFPNEKISKLYESGKITLFGSQSVSWLGVPLKLSGNTIGVMAVQCYEIADVYSVKDEELMVFVSDHIARAIENVRTEEKIRKQHLLVLEQQKDITDSIRYARRIQKAVLPSPAYIDNILSDYFTIYKPKDIIGGDFYWVREINNYTVIIVADATGHSVPGALMSMLGVTLLNEQFRTFGIRQPGVILGHLRSKVKEILAQEGSVNEQKDGMDMAIAIIDPEHKELQFAGANRPLFLIRKNDRTLEEEENPYLSVETDEYLLYVLKGDNQPIGVNWEETGFTDHLIKIREQDSLYLFSDGFVDQYGGEKRKKFKTRNFKKLLLSIQAESMENQRKLIEAAFETWRGSHEQIDDICMLGLRI
ncbi:MAG: GAF domain-containing SpoIIE family protein phosphatase [Bacteroidota bacterium]